MNLKNYLVAAALLSPAAAHSAEVPIYRLTNGSDVLLTTDAHQRNVLAGSGWGRYEGIVGYGWSTPGEPGAATTTLWRLYHPAAGHFHTTDQNEYNALAAAGWGAEGAVAEVLVQNAGSCAPSCAPLWRMIQHPRHVLAIRPADQSMYVSLGYAVEGGAPVGFLKPFQAEPIPVPTNPKDLKGVSADDWRTHFGQSGYSSLVSNANVKIGEVRIHWAAWEPWGGPTTPPPCSPTQREYLGQCFNVQVPQGNPPMCPSGWQEYLGRCYLIQDTEHDEIVRWKNAGVPITLSIDGVHQAWAADPACKASEVSRNNLEWCAPHAGALKDLALFMGMLAKRYNGKNGAALASDFMLFNEVNAHLWFNTGCGPTHGADANGNRFPVPCDKPQWVSRVADVYKASWDGVRAELPEAKVAMTFTNSFFSSQYAYSAHSDDSDPYSIPLQSFLAGHPGQGIVGFDTLVQFRDWHLRYHAYLPDPTQARFTPLEHQYSGGLGWGNIGTLSGWLKRAFPQRNVSIFLNEGGLDASSYIGSSPGRQNELVCGSFQNYVGTPGLYKWFFYRMRDNADSVCPPGVGCYDMQVGLHDAGWTPRPSWTTFVNANGSPGSCGFQWLPDLPLYRFYNPGSAVNQHWFSTRIPPPGYGQEGAAPWKLSSTPLPGGKMVYECLDGGHSVLTDDPKCDTTGTGFPMPMGPLGHVYGSPQPGTVPICQCTIAGGFDHLYTSDLIPGSNPPACACENTTFVKILGWARP